MDFSSSSDDSETAYEPPTYPNLPCSPWTHERPENKRKHDLHIEKYLKKELNSMSWRQVYHFMEKMGVGTEIERIKPKKITSPLMSRAESKKFDQLPLDESGLESSQFILNQLRRVLGNRKPKKRKRRRSRQANDTGYYGPT